MSAIGKKLKLLGTNFAFLILFLSIAEVGLRIANLGYDNAAFEPDSVLHHIHRPDYSFIHSNAAEHEYGNIPVRYDKMGCVVNPQQKETERCREKVWFFGDSYIEALQVDYDSSVTGLLEMENPDVCFKNFAVGAYSPILHYLKLKQLLKSEKPHVVFLFLYANDPAEDKQYLKEAKFYQGEVAAVDGGMPQWKYEIIRNSNLLRLIRKFYMQMTVNLENKQRKEESAWSENNVILTEPTLTYLKKFVMLCMNNNVKVIVSCIPSKTDVLRSDFNTSSFSNQIKAWCSGKCDFLDLQGPLQKFYLATNTSPYFKNDIHFNNYGHRIVARTIVLAQIIKD
ncbi:MAG TPA: hypothetical protein P5221_10490 [Bacteroidia bacterium]|nr:hypothetical protein [Bacteroidia bacterium]